MYAPQLNLPTLLPPLLTDWELQLAQVRITARVVGAGGQRVEGEAVLVAPHRVSGAAEEDPVGGHVQLAFTHAVRKPVRICMQRWGGQRGDEPNHNWIACTRACMRRCLASIV